MKKAVSKIIAVTLALTLVFTMSGTVFADAGLSAAEATGTSSAVSKTVNKLSVKADPSIEESGINSKTIVTNETSLPYKGYTVQAGSCIVVPVTVTNTGMLYYDLKADTDNSDYVDIYLVDDYNYNSQTGQVTWNVYSGYFRTYIGAGAAYNCQTPLPVGKGEVYYLIVSNNSDYYDEAVQIRSKIFTTGQRNLSVGTSKWTLASGYKYTDDGKLVSNTTYFKIKPSKSGLLRVDLKEYGYSSTYGSVTLCNSSKKAISETVDGDAARFGIKGGNTYYIKVSNCTGTQKYNYRFGIKYRVYTSYVDRSLSSKSKARTLTRKADYTKTLFTATNKTSYDWYKIKVTSKRKTQIKIDTAGINSGNVYVRVYRGSKQVGSTVTIGKSSGGSLLTLTYGTTYGKANSGTYYIKVSKSAKCSGLYKIRYVQ